ncbi:glutamate-5-semialdehyde dehydrogenase [Candidatus Enterococcus ferrettii]|uniref:Gamma-glutamyl phosphate reductase n=1 Tax=Candidatus Enterococcus ferrettii TaxID=2815324 RepID=A0ABV0EUT2_9ENTE|nr:glutamate-5-semialdehyde dehydrogenase [Enterococcus sp. 665A]MBO1339404.1 glutamate-5-semialdehyde dehydrogenase [Enterococcus sp. 665A]
MSGIEQLGKNAKQAAAVLNGLDTKTKNDCLQVMADKLRKHANRVLSANRQDLEQAASNGTREVMLDRLRLTHARIEDMAKGIEAVIELPDPIGEVGKMWRNEAGLLIGQQRVPLGVIGIIFESRPNVTTDAATLCFKTGNAVILRGGKDAFQSNEVLVTILQGALAACNLPRTCIQFVNDTSYEVANQMMTANEFLDVLIPRGGASLIKRITENATVPVIETGTGNNHIYVDQAAQLDMAANIILNAKVQRPSVCNSIETILVHDTVAAEFLPQVEQLLLTNQVELRACPRSIKYLESANPAQTEDWETEYLDLTLAVKVVDSLDEAIQHINKYNSGHSEAIVTDSYTAGQRFLKEVDAAAVYINASTRFTDGFMYGFGAEIGISTQKLHARGPMGLPELTSTKYIIYGDGQIRE